MKKVYSLAFVLALVAASCSSSTYEDISEEAPVIVETVTYNADVKAIIDANCISCHSTGQSASFRPLTTYNEVKSAVENNGLLSRIQRQNGESGVMPQGGRMPQARIDIIVQWVEDGTLEQ